MRNKNIIGYEGNKNYYGDDFPMFDTALDIIDSFFGGPKRGQGYPPPPQQPTKILGMDPTTALVAGIGAAVVISMLLNKKK